MVMRDSKILRKLKEGKVASCIKLNLSDPRVTEMASLLGFDSVWIDMEHVPTDWSAVENHIRAAKIYDTDVMVRVARGSYSDYVRPLEADAAGIMVPHIMNYEEAKNIVKTLKFYPIGRRPLDGGNADGAFTMMDIPRYIEEANSKRFICIQIEDPEPLDELDKIVALEGIDIVFFGPGDFSQGIKAPGDWVNPKIIETRRLIAKTCLKYGKYAGTVANPENIEELVQMGYRFLSVGADVVGLSTYFKSIAEIFKRF